MKPRYFSHDCNARNDEKCTAVRIRHGWAGYGLYWALIERLAESSDNTLAADYNLIGYDLRCDAGLIKSIVEEFGLFTKTEDGSRFYSKSFLEREQKSNEISAKRTEAIRKRWNRDVKTADTDTKVPDDGYKSNTNVSKSDTNELQMNENSGLKRKKEKNKEEYVRTQAAEIFPESGLSEEWETEAREATAGCCDSVKALFRTWVLTVKEISESPGVNMRRLTLTALRPALMQLHNASPSDAEKIAHLNAAIAGGWRNLDRNYSKQRDFSQKPGGYSKPEKPKVRTKREDYSAEELVKMSINDKYTAGITTLEEDIEYYEKKEGNWASVIEALKEELAEKQKKGKEQ